jgi:hypothetical protein
VYSTGDGKCGESTLNCLYVGPAKAAQAGLKDGTCADQGYTVATGETQTQKTPVGDIVVTFYEKPSLEVAKDCTVYSIGDGKCGESTLNCLYVGPAKAAQAGLKDGTCADQGYTEATGETQTQKTPVGDIVVTFYEKPSLEVAKDCTVYSTGDGKCGESTLNCLYVGPAKAAQAGLKDGTCADQDYTEATGETQTQKTPVGDIVVTFYEKPSLSVAKDCTVYSIGDGKCGESILNCLYVGPAKLANKDLKDGTCASQGYTVATGETQTTSTPVGDITITFYMKPAYSIIL